MQRRANEQTYLKVSDVGEEEADEGEGQRPFRDGADDVSGVTLKHTHTFWFFLIIL